MIFSVFRGSKCNETKFNRIFRMPNVVFQNIYSKFISISLYLLADNRKDFCRRDEISSLVKVTTALRVLLNGVPADILKESLQISETFSLNLFIDFAVPF